MESNESRLLQRASHRPWTHTHRTARQSIPLAVKRCRTEFPKVYLQMRVYGHRLQLAIFIVAVVAILDRPQELGLGLIVSTRRVLISDAL